MKARTKRNLGPALAGAALAFLVALAFLNLSSGEKKIRHRIEHVYAVSDPQFARSVGSLLGPPLLDGNAATTLLNGDEIFPSMLEAIRGAKRSITFETYIYWSGRIGQEFADALAERARAGVKVHVLLDWLGSAKMEARLLEEMNGAGVQVEKYHPLRWYHLARLNNRTHRKILVVDGRIGFTGGVGIADKWLGHAQDADHWRDTHVRIEGPAVAEMQAAFLDNWTKTHAEVLHGEAYFPPLEPRGPYRAQVFRSSPREGAESIRLMVLLSIASATSTIDIANSYFVPDDLIVEALVAARRRGVAVRILVPGPITDTETVRKASRSRWGDLLAAGAEIWEYQPTMMHCKVMVVDRLWVSIGSTNFDARSFRLNDEANLNVYGAEFAARNEQVFAQDLARSRRVTLEEWRRRPLGEKLLDFGAGLLRSQL